VAASITHLPIIAVNIAPSRDIYWVWYQFYLLLLGLFNNVFFISVVPFIVNIGPQLDSIGHTSKDNIGLSLYWCTYVCVYVSLCTL